MGLLLIVGEVVGQTEDVAIVDVDRKGHRANHSSGAEHAECTRKIHFFPQSTVTHP